MIVALNSLSDLVYAYTLESMGHGKVITNKEGTKFYIDGKEATDIEANKVKDFPA